MANVPHCLPSTAPHAETLGRLAVGGSARSLFYPFPTPRGACAASRGIPVSHVNGQRVLSNVLQGVLLALPLPLLPLPLPLLQGLLERGVLLPRNRCT